jgi:hypothetical protein
MRSPLEFGVGLAKGSRSLFTHTIGGVAESLSAIGFTIGKGTCAAPAASVMIGRRFLAADHWA